MKVYKKESVQHINASLEECWSFFSNPKNLQIITPKSMGFEVTDYDDKLMYTGQIIQYKITPLLGIKLNWMTEITVVKENSYFIDEQRFGPYTLWHHKHFFEATANALKYSNATEFIVDYQLDSELVITISDNGTGFPADKIAYVFDKFYRLPNTKTGGNGLGLSIVKGFVEAQKGNIELENNEKGGATFRIEFPAKTTYINQLKNE